MGVYWNINILFVVLFIFAKNSCFKGNTRPSDSDTVLLLFFPALLCNIPVILQTLCVDTRSRVSFQDEAKKKKHYIDHGDRLAVSFDISSCSFLFIQTFTLNMFIPTTVDR